MLLGDSWQDACFFGGEEQQQDMVTASNSPSLLWPWELAPFIGL